MADAFERLLPIIARRLRPEPGAPSQTTPETPRIMREPA
jgi:hypothetical protein